MNEKERAAFRQAIKPIGESIAETFTSALECRVSISLVIAMNNGAEPEDIGDIIADAIDGGVAMMNVAFDEISMKARRDELNTK